MIVWSSCAAVTKHRVIYKQQICPAYCSQDGEALSQGAVGIPDVHLIPPSPATSNPHYCTADVS